MWRDIRLPIRPFWACVCYVSWSWCKQAFYHHLFADISHSVIRVKGIFAIIERRGWGFGKINLFLMTIRWQGASAHITRQLFRFLLLCRWQEYKTEPSVNSGNLGIPSSTAFSPKLPNNNCIHRHCRLTLIHIWISQFLESTIVYAIVLIRWRQNFNE